MKVYATTKNSGPSWSHETIFLVYLGTSFDAAKLAVGDFTRDEKAFPETWSARAHCALPNDIDITLVKYYMSDGWWYTIVEFELAEE